MGDSQDSWDPDIPGPSKQQDETPAKQDKKSKKKSDKDRDEKQSESVGTLKKRKAEDTAGMSKSEEQKQRKHNKRLKKSTFIPGTSQNQDEIPAESDTESAQQISNRRNSQPSESKCCKKKCLHLVNSQVQEKLNQEFKEQSNQSLEHERSYLRKYIYPDKKEKNSNGTPRNVIYHYRIPRRVPFQDDEKKKEICQKAFLKIFGLKEWALRRAREEFGKWINIVKLIVSGLTVLKQIVLSLIEASYPKCYLTSG